MTSEAALDYFDVSNDSTLRERFTRKVDRAEDGECWLWIGSRSETGYGKIGVRVADGHLQPKFAHRVAYALKNGRFPNELCVLHRCDNPRCVNPTHLALGTQKDNIQDMIAKGRNQNAIELSSQRMTGHHPSAETRLKMRHAKLGAAHWRAKAVSINGVDYPCLRDAARALDVTEACVRKWTKNGKAQLKTERVSTPSPAHVSDCRVAI